MPKRSDSEWVRYDDSSVVDLREQERSKKLVEAVRNHDCFYDGDLDDALAEYEKYSHNESVHGDCLDYMASLPKESVDLVIADPPYGDFPLINQAIREARRVCRGASIFFMYAEDLVSLDQHPDQVLFWVKPVSTKNTSKRYSRFVEVIALYDLEHGPYNKAHWSCHTGIFTDCLISGEGHPYRKPRSLIEKLVVIHSNPGDVILDPFAGSGTVGSVARSLGRECISVDIEPLVYEYTKPNGTRYRVTVNGNRVNTLNLTAVENLWRNDGDRRTPERDHGGASGGSGAEGGPGGA